MDLITQILAALVLILALALYNRSSTTTTTTTGNTSSKGGNSESLSSKSNSKKSNKKKKKSSNTKPTSALDANGNQPLGSNNRSSSLVEDRPSPDINQDTPKSSKHHSSRSSILSSMPSPPSNPREQDSELDQRTEARDANHSSSSSARTNAQRREEINKKKMGKGEERVADMIDREIIPETTYERVARIPAASQQSQTNYSSNDYEEWEQLPVEDQGGWESVGQGSKSSRLQSSSSSTSKINPSSNGVSAYASNNPFAALPDGVDSSYAAIGKNGVAKSLKIPSIGNVGAVKSSTNSRGVGAAQSAANQEPTKKQRQNAAKAAAKKSQKDAEEKQRLERLANHKKAVEAERMKEFYSKGSGSKPSSKTNGGPKASVNQNGALVWD